MKSSSNPRSELVWWSIVFLVSLVGLILDIAHDVKFERLDLSIPIILMLMLGIAGMVRSWRDLQKSRS